MVVESWLARAARTRPDTRCRQRAHLRGAASAGARRAAGLPRGARVGIALPPGEDYVVALHACLLAGALVSRRPAAHARPSARRSTCCSGELACAPAPRAARAHDLDAPAILVHTSGTTAKPKPIRLTYGNWLWSALGSAVALGVDPDERWLCTLPLSHVGGLSILLRSAIYGTTAIVHERFETDRVLHALNDPTADHRLARAHDARAPARRRPQQPARAALGAARRRAAAARAAPARRDAGVPVAPTYGLTEACSQVATAGVPLFCTRVELAPDGEIVVTGPTVAPDAAADGCSTPATSAPSTTHGLLQIVGRKADTIVTGGENVAPAEVEAVLEAHPAVPEAAVLGRPDDAWGEAIVAPVVLRDGSHAERRRAPRPLRARLARFKVPKDDQFAAPLPRTASGKLLRRELGDDARRR